MKEKKLQIFVSSTFKDLIEERQAAVEAILSSGHIPAGMELFSAGDESQMTVIKRWIDESDIYLLILGGRYGSIERTTGKSYTQLEFEYALERKKPLFAIVISDNALNSKVKLHGIEAMEQENQQSLTAFKNLVLQNLVKFWDDTKDIKIAIHDHPIPNHYATPDSVLAAMQGHPNIGSCADVGHWSRNGLNAVECLKKLEGHVYGVHLKDITQFGNHESPDTAVSHGVVDFPAIFAELKRQHFTGMFSIEQESNWYHSLPDVMNTKKYFEDQEDKLK